MPSPWWSHLAEDWQWLEWWETRLVGDLLVLLRKRRENRRGTPCKSWKTKGLLYLCIYYVYIHTYLYIYIYMVSPPMTPSSASTFSFSRYKTISLSLSHLEQYPFHANIWNNIPFIHSVMSWGGPWQKNSQNIGCFGCFCFFVFFRRSFGASCFLHGDLPKESQNMFFTWLVSLRFFWCSFVFSMGPSPKSLNIVVLVFFQGFLLGPP